MENMEIRKNAQKQQRIFGIHGSDKNGPSQEYSTPVERGPEYGIWEILGTATWN